MKPLRLLTLLVFTLIFSCKNDDDNSLSDTNPNPNPEVFTENFGAEINRDFLGEVVDPNNNPIQNATVTIGNQTTLTDANGVFIIRDANIYERFGYVKVEKAGYIDGSRSVVPTSGTNKVKIMLLEEIVAGTTASGTTETISLSNGASVALEGEYIKEDGSAYSGTVNVIMHHLDPTNENMRDQMPGMLYAANAQNEERMLQTFGMLAVELRGSNGEDLNLATGSTAEITVPLDASLLATAPATIPLWYFDEVAGYWKEEGQATLVGNTYVGIVSHFSFWNCDIPVETVNLCFNVFDSNGNPLSGLAITITSENIGSNQGFTNMQGEVCGLIPSNELLSVTVSSDSNSCTNLYSDYVGPFSSDSEINVIVEMNNEWITETITGNFNNCSGNLIADGYVELYNQYGTLLDIDLVSNGNFELTNIRCNDDSNIFKIKGVDIQNFNETDLINFTYTSPFTNIGTIAACNTINEFITYQLDNEEPVTLFNFTVKIVHDLGGNVPDYLNIISTHQNFGELRVNGFFHERYNPPYIGTYNGWFLYINNEEMYGNTIENQNGGPGSLTSYISNHGEIDEYIDISFSGLFYDNDDPTRTPHTINGIAHVLLDEIINL